MKRYGNLFEKIITLENIELAHKKAKKDKSFYNEVKMVEKNPDYYFKQIQEMLINKTYTIKHSDYTMFTKVDKGKTREIYKLDYFPHRIIQHALLNVTQDIFLKSFISNTFASIPNRGIHLALKKLNKDIKSNKDKVSYCLKIDIKKFYPSINQEILKNQLRLRIKDKETLWLFDTIINSMDKGIAIGSLVSQWLGNYNLTFFDHWIKENKKMKYYYRYCDDVVILHNNKEELHDLRKEIEEYLRIKLDLKLKDNWQVFPTFKRGVDFVGYRHFGHYVLLRKTTSKNMITKLKKVSKKCDGGKDLTYSDWCSVNSYRGWVEWCNGYNLYKKHIKPLHPHIYNYYVTNIKKRDDYNMNKFSEFANPEDNLLCGDKLKIDSILGKEIVVKNFKLGKSKHDFNKELITLGYELDGTEYITFTTSSVLIDQCKKYRDKLPFIAKIEKINKFYSFT